MNKIYIRIGEIPENERSKIHNKEPAEYEKGVSVWNAVKLDDGYHLVAPIKGNSCTYGDFLADAFPDEYYGKYLPTTLKIYVVTGDEIGRGADNEPLLKNIKIIETLPYNYFTYESNPYKIKVTKNFHFLGKQKYESKFGEPIFLMDTRYSDDEEEIDNN